MDNWVLYCFLVMVFTASILSIYKLFIDSRYEILTLLAITFVVLGLVGVIYLLSNRDKFLKFYKQYDYKILVLILVYVLLTILIKYFIQKAVKSSPSIGLCHLIINMNVILTLFIGYFLFGETINNTTIFGISVTLVGLAIVLSSSKNNKL